MSQIYRLSTDPTVYKELPIDVEEIAEQLGAESRIMDFVYMGIKDKRLSDIWGPVSSAFEPSPAFPEAVKIPTISVWTGPNLLLSERAYAVFRLMLSEYGEFLPINVSGFTYYLFNNLTDITPDLTKSRYSDPDSQEVETLVFGDDANDKLIFRSFWEGCTTSFCNQQFKDLCEEFELEGLSFNDI